MKRNNNISFIINLLSFAFGKAKNLLKKASLVLDVLSITNLEETNQFDVISICGQLNLSLSSNSVTRNFAILSNHKSTTPTVKIFTVTQMTETNCLV